MSAIRNGHYKVFCAGDSGSKRWLATKENEIKVVQKPAAHWHLENTDKGITINTKGSYIDGNTKEGKVRLVLLGNADSGVYWNLELSGEYYLIQCLNRSDGDKRYLDGSTGNSNVSLHADTTKSGSQWLLIPV